MSVRLSIDWNDAYILFATMAYLDGHLLTVVEDLEWGFFFTECLYSLVFIKINF